MCGLSHISLDEAPEPLVPEVVGEHGLAGHEVAEDADGHRHQSGAGGYVYAPSFYSMFVLFNCGSVI